MVVFMCFAFVVLLECIEWDINNKQNFLGVKQEVSALLTQAERLFRAENYSLSTQNKLILL